MEAILGITGGTAFAAAFLFNEAFKKASFVNNKYLPLIGLVSGLGIGLLFGVFVEPGALKANLVMGMLAGGNSTTFNELYNHLFGGNKNAND